MTLFEEEEQTNGDYYHQDCWVYQDLKKLVGYDDDDDPLYLEYC